MKITYYTNACCVYEHEGYQLMADPWLTNGAFEGSWHHAMDAKLPTDEDFEEVDALYISHVHPDHFDAVALAKFRRDIPIVVLDHGPNFLHRKLEELGFTNLIALPDGVTSFCGPLAITMYAPFAKHPFEQSVLGNFLDSAIVVEAGGKTVLNANDNTPTPEAAKTLYERHGKFSIAQLKLCPAGPYPSCFRNLSTNEKLAEKERLLTRQVMAMNSVGSVLDASEIHPFAGNYCLAGSLAEKNKFLAVDKIDLTQVPEGTAYSYERGGHPRSEDLLWKCMLARRHLWKKQTQFKFFPDYRVSIHLGNEKYYSFNFNNEKGDQKVRADLICLADPRLLNQILDRTSHFNNAEVGCHIDFIRVPNIYKPDVHTMMSFFHT